jgi:hypothetical protein
MPSRRSPLFSAVVLAGVSLTGAASVTACGDDDNAPKNTGPDASSSSSSSSSGSTATDAGTDSPSASDAATDADACPPDAELPTPPCYLIK